MRKIILNILGLLFFSNSFAQFSNESYVYQGLTRKYRVYVPISYDGSKPVPLVLCLHGLGDNMVNFSSIGMNYIADTANFIVVFPQAIVDPVVNAAAWNSGAGYLGYFPNTNVDDVGFLKSLMDTLSIRFSINQKKIFACCFSMGGFMSNRLACEANDRVTAIASVSGTLGAGFSCLPGKAISVCHFHGTADGTVSFNDGPYGKGAQSLVDFWVQNNNCNVTPSYDALPNIANDNFTVEQYEYTSGDSSTEVLFYKVNNAGHVWLTSANDISYSTEIWKFFNKQMLSMNTKEKQECLDKNSFEIHPNIGNGIFNIHCKKDALERKFQMWNAEGKLLKVFEMNAESMVIDVSSFSNGIYYIGMQNGKNSSTQKLILSK